MSGVHAHIQCLDGEATYKLKETDKRENLNFGFIRDGIPRFRSRRDGWKWSTVHLHGPREVDSVGVDNVTCSKRRYEQESLVMLFAELKPISRV